VSEGGTPRALVVGIGNPDRGDDGFGAAVIARLRGHVPPAVRLAARSGDILGLIDEWDGFDAVVLIDAAAPIARTGRVHRLDPTAGPLPIGWSVPSTHAFGLGETVELARRLGRLPRRLVLYLVEGEEFGTGAALSPVVESAIEEVAGQIVLELSAIFGTDQAGETACHAGDVA
jgi:hydrogenase maturation protease